MTIKFENNEEMLDAVIKLGHSRLLEFVNDIYDIGASVESRDGAGVDPNRLLIVLLTHALKAAHATENAFADKIEEVRYDH